MAHQKSENFRFGPFQVTVVHSWSTLSANIEYAVIVIDHLVSIHVRTQMERGKNCIGREEKVALGLREHGLLNATSWQSVVYQLEIAPPM